MQEILYRYDTIKRTVHRISKRSVDQLWQPFEYDEVEDKVNRSIDTIVSNLDEVKDPLERYREITVAEILSRRVPPVEFS